MAGFWGDSTENMQAKGIKTNKNTRLCFLKTPLFMEINDHYTKEELTFFLLEKVNLQGNVENTDVTSHKWEHMIIDNKPPRRSIEPSSRKNKNLKTRERKFRGC